MTTSTTTLHQTSRPDRSEQDHLFDRFAKDHLRYVVWLLLANTANANRRHFRLTTTWVPHLVGNSISLLLPDIYRRADNLFNLSDRLSTAREPAWTALHAAFRELVAHNRDYVDYVTPAALAYVVSHPRFNIYRGEWAALSFYGFGLDSIPHAATAYALSVLLYDALEVLDRQTPPNAAIAPYVRQAAGSPVFVVGATMAFLTIAYETGEYLIHKSELQARDYDRSRINMMWSLKDSVFDGLSNAVGWLFATLRRV